MARQFKIEAKYAGPPLSTAEIYWHDNDTIEFVTVPPNIGPDSLIGRTELVENLIRYMKTSKVNSITVNRTAFLVLDSE